MIDALNTEFKKEAWGNKLEHTLEEIYNSDDQYIDVDTFINTPLWKKMEEVTYIILLRKMLTYSKISLVDVYYSPDSERVCCSFVVSYFKDGVVDADVIRIEKEDVYF